MPEETSNGIDRRSALKKAAAAGAVAWSVPTVMSSKAHAVEIIDGCTVKCAPVPSISIGANTGLACQGPGGKWAQITFTLTSVLCPCDAGGSGAVFLGGSFSPNPAEVKQVTFNQETGVGTILVGGMGNGALGNGTYSGTLNYCVQCADRTSDILSRQCSANISFSFQPADGPCSTEDNVGDANLTGNSCGGINCEPCAVPG